MRVIAVCGPIGVQLDSFVTEFISSLNSSKTVDCFFEKDYAADFRSLNHDALAKEVKNSVADMVIVTGHFLFVDEELRSLMNVKIFLESSSEACLIQFLREADDKSSQATATRMANYLEVMKPKNQEEIIPSSKHADLVIPSAEFTSNPRVHFAAIQNLLRSNVEALPTFFTLGSRSSRLSVSDDTTNAMIVR